MSTIPTADSKPQVKDHKSIKFILLGVSIVLFFSVTVVAAWLFSINMQSLKEYSNDKFSILVPSKEYNFSQPIDSSYNWTKPAKEGDSYSSITIMNMKADNKDGNQLVGYVDNEKTEQALVESMKKEGYDLKDYKVIKSTNGDYTVRKLGYDLYKDGSVYSSTRLLYMINKENIYSITVYAQQDPYLTKNGYKIIDSFKLK